VRAEQDAGVTDEPVAGPLTEVINVRGSRPSGAAQTSVVDAERFAGEAPTVAELLATSPGVSVQRSGGPGQAAFVSLRGASPDQTLVLLDGIPLQGPGGDAIDLSTLPSSFVSKVVVSRGVLGAQLGRCAKAWSSTLFSRAPRPAADCLDLWACSRRGRVKATKAGSSARDCGRPSGRP